MTRNISQTLLKIKKEEYPEIFDFLENVPPGTKTAHIREALLRYINEIDVSSPGVPTKAKSSKNHTSTTIVNNRRNRKKADSVEESASPEISVSEELSPVEDDEELVPLNIDMI